MYEQPPIQSEQDNRIIEVSARISEILGVFDRVRRLNACIGTDGRHFEQLM